MASTPSLICGTYLQNCPSSTPNVPKQLCYPCFPIDGANGKANRRSKPASLPSRDPADAYPITAIRWLYALGLRPGQLYGAPSIVCSVTMTTFPPADQNAPTPFLVALQSHLRKRGEQAADNSASRTADMACY